jgi:glycosyltransferase involved in cell wall biosynthesis
MSQTLVTVIIPAYNCASTVAETLESVLAQDHAATEVVVVNDGSKDDTLQVLSRFGERIRVIDQPNAGPPAARNTGLRAARGEYIAFLDADDVWIQGKLAAQARHLDTNPDVGTVFTDWYVWNPEPDGSFRRRPEIEARTVDDRIDPSLSGWLYPRLLFGSELLTTTVMMRASVIRRMGDFDVRLWNGDDYDYWLRASREGRITKLASIGALYRILPNSVSRRPREINYEYEVVKAAIDRFGLRGPDGSEADPAAMVRRLDELQIAHAYGHLLRGDAALALRTYRAMLAKHPTRPKLWLNTARAALKARSQRQAAA